VLFSPFRVRRRAARWVSVTTSVIDRGVGISAQNQTGLFANFAQVRPGALQAGQGSGLGLAMCKQIVELHGGAISVQSEEGRGSTFAFTIPFAVADADAVAAEAADESDSAVVNVVVGDELTRAQEQHVPLLSANALSINGDVAASRVSLASLEVLVVDDAASNRNIMSALLKKKGVRSAAVENGLLAFDLLSADPTRFHLVLMDNLMPVMDGVEATRRLRAAGYRHLIAGVTGNVLDDDVREYLDAGADLVLAKPLKIASIAALLAHVCGEGPRSRAAEGLALALGGDAPRWVPASAKPSLA
jgi:CheY-like chemotaxis protein